MSSWSRDTGGQPLLSPWEGDDSGLNIPARITLRLAARGIDGAPGWLETIWTEPAGEEFRPPPARLRPLAPRPVGRQRPRRRSAGDRLWLAGGALIGLALTLAWLDILYAAGRFLARLIGGGL